MQSAYKAPGGLIRVELLDNDGKIADLAIAGDFTCMPSNAIDVIIKHLFGVKLSMEALSTTVDTNIEKHTIEMPGVPGTDIAIAILVAADHNE